MKKLMTASIIILPFLLLAIMFVSSAIVANFAHIYVETVESIEKEALVLIMNDESDPPEYDLNGHENILPISANNRGRNFSLDDKDFITVSGSGKVQTVYYGETHITVASKENKAAVAKRKVLVTDENVHLISINDKQSLDHTDLYEGDFEDNAADKLKLSVSVNPKEAKIKNVVWTSPDGGQAGRRHIRR